VMGVSLITNMAAGIDKPLSHEEVKAAADQAGEKFVSLIVGTIAKI